MLPDSRTMRVGAERFLAPEILLLEGNSYHESNGDFVSQNVGTFVEGSDSPCRFTIRLVLS